MSETSNLVPGLIGKLGNREPSVRIEVAKGLAVLGPAAKDAVPALIAALGDPDVHVRGAAAVALGRIGPDAKDAVDRLVGLLEDAVELARWTAVYALGQIGPAANSAVPSIILKLQDEADIVRSAAMDALGKIGPDGRTVTTLVQSLSHQKDEVVWAAARILGKIGDAAVPFLIEGLLSRKQIVRWACARALGKIGPAAHTAVPALIASLPEPKKGEGLYDVPPAAAEALGRIGPAAASAIPALVESLRENHIRMQFEVAKAIKGIDPAHAVPALIPLLAEKEAGWGASHVLSEIGVMAVPSLIAVLEIGSGMARFHACFAIRTIAGIGSQAKDAIPVLIRLLSDDDGVVRCEADRALAAIEGR